MRTRILLCGAIAVLIAFIGCSRRPEIAHAIAESARVEVIAHRGASAYAPENTMAAFKLANEMGADWFELDCTLSKDGRVIVIHDDDTERTTGVPGKVKDLTLDELKKLDAGSWKSPDFAGERLPTLEETFDFSKGKIGVYVEIKNSDDDTVLVAEILAAAQGTAVADDALKAEIIKLAEARGSRNVSLTREVIRIIREYDIAEEIVIQSFSPIVCTIAAIEAPEMRTEILAYEDEEKHPGRWEMYLRFFYLLGLDGLNTNRDTLTEGRLAAIHAAHKTVALYTINDDADMKKYIEWGVDRIITDRPDRCLDIAGTMAQR